MFEPQPILGTVLFFAGCFAIAYNEEGARRFEESQKALGKWGMKKHAYSAGRFVSIVGGAILVLAGAVILFNFQFPN
jgi:hypothetical protein